MNKEIEFIRHILSVISQSDVAFPIARNTHESIVTASPSRDLIPLLIKTLRHTQHELNFDCKKSVIELKKVLQNLCNVPATQQRIIWKGKAISNELSLIDAIRSIHQEPKPVVLHLVERQLSSDIRETSDSSQQHTQNTAEASPITTQVSTSSSSIGVTILTTSTMSLLQPFDHATFQRLLNEYANMHRCNDSQCRARIQEFIQHYHSHQ